MEILWKFCLKHIALSGAAGSTFDNICSAVLDDMVGYSIDSFIEQWIWLQIRQDVSNVSPSNRLDLFLSRKSSMIPSPTTGYNLFDTERVALTIEDAPIHVKELKESKKWHGEDGLIRIAASESVRRLRLGILDPELSLSPITLAILELVGQSKRAGVLQTQLASRLQICSKNVFHHLKKLESYNLVVRRSVLCKRAGNIPASHTNLVLLTDFSSTSTSHATYPNNLFNEMINYNEDHAMNPNDVVVETPVEKTNPISCEEQLERMDFVEDQMEMDQSELDNHDQAGFDDQEDDITATPDTSFFFYGDIAMRVCYLLASARHGILRESELKRAASGMISSKRLNSTWPSVRKMLQDAGFVTIFKAKIINNGSPRVSSRSFSSTTQHQILNCVRLLRMPTSQKEIEARSNAYSPSAITHQLLVEYPVDYQLWKLIKDAGAQGIIQAELRPHSLNRRLVMKKVESLIKIRKLVKAIPCHMHRGKTTSFILKSIDSKTVQDISQQNETGRKIIHHQKSKIHVDHQQEIGHFPSFPSNGVEVKSLASCAILNESNIIDKNDPLNDVSSNHSQDQIISNPPISSVDPIDPLLHVSISADPNSSNIPHHPSINVSSELIDAIPRSQKTKTYTQERLNRQKLIVDYLEKHHLLVVGNIRKLLHQLERHPCSISIPSTIVEQESASKIGSSTLNPAWNSSGSPEHMIDYKTIRKIVQDIVDLQIGRLFSTNIQTGGQQKKVDILVRQGILEHEWLPILYNMTNNELLSRSSAPLVPKSNHIIHQDLNIESNLSSNSPSVTTLQDVVEHVNKDLLRPKVIKIEDDQYPEMANLEDSSIKDPTYLDAQKLSTKAISSNHLSSHLPSTPSETNHSINLNPPEISELQLALQLGLEKARMMRAKILHLWLCQELLGNHFIPDTKVNGTNVKDEIDNELQGISHLSKPHHDPCSKLARLPLDLVSKDRKNPSTSPSFKKQRFNSLGERLSHFCELDNAMIKANVFLDRISKISLSKTNSSSVTDSVTFSSNTQPISTSSDLIDDQIYNEAGRRWYNGPEFNLESILLRMPVSTFCQSIGLMRSIPNIQQAIQNQSRIEDLDVTSRSMILQRSHYQRRLEKMLSILRYLNLLHPKLLIIKELNPSTRNSREKNAIIDENDVKPCLSLQILNPVGLVWWKNNASPSQNPTDASIDPFTHTDEKHVFFFDNPTLRHRYWDVLEYASKLKIEETLMVDFNPQSLPSTSSNIPPSIRLFPTQAGLPQVCLIENHWNGLSSRRAIRKLRHAWKFVQPEMNSTLSHDQPTPLMSRIALELNYKPQQVLNFYQRYQSRLNQKKIEHLTPMTADAFSEHYQRLDPNHVDSLMNHNSFLLGNRSIPTHVDQLNSKLVFDTSHHGIQSPTISSRKPIQFKINSTGLVDTNHQHDPELMPLQHPKSNPDPLDLVMKDDHKEAYHGILDSDELIRQTVDTEHNVKKRSGRWTSFAASLLIREFIHQKVKHRLQLDDIDTIWKGIDKNEFSALISRPFEMIDHQIRKILSTKASWYQLGRTISQSINQQELVELKHKNHHHQNNSLQSPSTLSHHVKTQLGPNQFRLPRSISWIRQHYDIDLDSCSLKTSHLTSDLQPHDQTIDHGESSTCGHDVDYLMMNQQAQSITDQDPLPSQVSISKDQELLDSTNRGQMRHINSINVPIDNLEISTQDSPFFQPPIHTDYISFLDSSSTLPSSSSWLTPLEYDAVLADYLKMILLTDLQSIDSQEFMRIITTQFSHEQAASCFSSLRRRRIISMVKIIGSGRRFRVTQRLTQILKDGEHLVALSKEAQHYKSNEIDHPNDMADFSSYSPDLLNLSSIGPGPYKHGVEEETKMTAMKQSDSLFNWKLELDPFIKGGHVAAVLECAQDNHIVLDVVKEIKHQKKYQDRIRRKKRRRHQHCHQSLIQSNPDDPSILKNESSFSDEDDPELGFQVNAFRWRENNIYSRYAKSYAKEEAGACYAPQISVCNTIDAQSIESSIMPQGHHLSEQNQLHSSCSSPIGAEQIVNTNINQQSDLVTSALGSRMEKMDFEKNPSFDTLSRVDLLVTTDLYYELSHSDYSALFQIQRLDDRVNKDLLFAIYKLVCDAKDASLNIYQLEFQLVQNKTILDRKTHFQMNSKHDPSKSPSIYTNWPKTPQNQDPSCCIDSCSLAVLLPQPLTLEIYSILSHLENFRLVYRVLGCIFESWVSHSYLDKWTMVQKKEVEDNRSSLKSGVIDSPKIDNDLIVLNPWISLDGSVNYQYLQCLKASIAAMIIRSPGIDEERLIQEFELFRPSVTMELLRLLLLNEAIFVKYFTYKARKPIEIWKSNIVKDDGEDRDKSVHLVMPAFEQDYHHYLARKIDEITNPDHPSSTIIVQKCYWSSKSIHTRI